MLNLSNLHKYQLVSVLHIIKNRFCGLFLDMGLGKTISTLTAINKLIYEEADILRVLMIAPKRVAESVWSAEIENWSHVQHLKISKIIGTQKQRINALNKEADIYTIGRDNVAWLCGYYGGLEVPFDMLVVDESSSFKNSKSQRFKALRKVLPSFNRVVILTGTPAPNSLIDLWPQIYLLDRGERLGKYITNFRDNFFNRDYNGFSYSIREGSENTIHNRIGDICISMKAEDYLDLPERINNNIIIELPEGLRKKYEDFEKQKVLELYGNGSEGVEITTLNAAALTNKLLQFANGAVYDEDKEVHEVHNLKLDELEELIEEAQGNPVLIAYTYKHDCDRILSRLKKYKPVKLNTDKDIQDWNAGKIRVMVMHPASGGHGLNLQSGGNIIIWFGQTWSLELYQQFNARLDRQGQKKAVIVHHILVKNTMDMDVVKSLDRKADTQEGLMSAVKARIEKYLNIF